MDSLITRLLPYCPSGLFLRWDEQTLFIGGYEAEAELLEQIRSEWPLLAREEALARLRRGLEARRQQLRPTDFADLTARLQLGRLKLEERERLNAYYDALDALDETAAQLETAIATADVAALNATQWPEWVNWTPIPENPRFVRAEPESAVASFSGDSQVA